MTPPDAGASSGERRSGVLRALRSRNYRLYFFGQGVSLVGTWMTFVTTNWLVYRLSDSAIWLGVVGFAGQIPAFLLSPIGGVFVDRWNRARVLVITQILAMLHVLVLAWLALTGRITMGQIVALSILQGLINAFDLPARQAFVVEMVEHPDDLGNAIALNSLLFNGARLVGPPIAGVLIASVGEGMCFLVDGVSYLAVIAAFVMMRLAPVCPLPHARPMWRELREGLVYAYDCVPIRAVLALTALMSLVGLPYSVLLPVFAREILHGGPQTLGFLTGASGCGALAGAVYLASRKNVLGLGRMILVATVLFGGSLIAFGLSRSLGFSLVLMWSLGFGMLVQMAGGNILMQTIVDEDKRGRIMSFFAMAFMGMMPFGSLCAGYLANHIGAPVTLLLGGLGCLAGAALFARQLPRLRAILRPIYVRKGILPEVPAGLQTIA